MVSPYFVIRTVHAINACVFLCDPPTTCQLTPMLPSTSSSLACASGGASQEPNLGQHSNVGMLTQPT
jgi:hypothetical protein